MIKVYNGGIERSFEITKFPDDTSQVWKCYPNDKSVRTKILWHWENNELELIYLLQLMDLVSATFLSDQQKKFDLYIPYLPYARQDKKVDPNLTFAKKTFLDTLSRKYPISVYTFDMHSQVGLPDYFEYYGWFTDIKPTAFHKCVYRIYKPDITFYPDKGAAARYSVGMNEIQLFGEKVRNQATGEITGYKVCNTEYFNLQNKRVLIVDDICDGGATFITAANELKKLGVSDIALCVSHGIFSKGKQVLHDAGINRLFYTNSLLKNTDGFDVVNDFMKENI